MKTTVRSKITSLLTATLFIALMLFNSCATSRLGKKGQQKLAGKVFVIIGASSGFGKGMALELGRCHAHVVLAARRKELLDTIATQITASGGSALVVETDISKPEDVQHLADTALKTFGHINVWVNDAGVISLGTFWSVPIEEHARVVDVNLKGFMYGTYAAINIFRKQGYGTLINVGSMDSEIPVAYQASYSATKAAIRAMDNAIHQELRLDGHKNIRVVTIMPWATDTPIWRHAGNHTGGTPRMGFMDGPQVVVNAMLHASLRHKRELPIGWKGKLFYDLHHIFPHSVEKLAAGMEYKYQIKTAPPAPPTSGNLFEPMKAGTGVDDGVRQRMKEENRERRKAKRHK